MPAPRRTEGLAGGAMRYLFSWPYRLALAFLYRAGVRPWQLTLASLLSNVAIGWLLITRRYFLAGALLVPAGLFDIFDGAVARLRGEEKRSGAFLDSVLDRISDAILFSCLFWADAAQGPRLQAGLARAPPVVGRSAVSILSFTSTGTPCKSDRGPFASRSASSARASSSARGLRQRIALSLGPT